MAYAYSVFIQHCGSLYWRPVGLRRGEPITTSRPRGYTELGAKRVLA